MIIAGLDIATHTGCCIGRAGEKPRFFTVDLGSGKSHDHRFAESMKLARRLIAEEGVEAIGIEAPIKAGHDKKSTNELLMGLIANVRGWAYIKGIPCETFETRTIDKHCLSYVPKGRDERKRAIAKWCLMQSWKPDSQDSADAGMVWEVMCSRMSPAYAAASGTLLRGRVA